ncbi:MAG: hypothetical protein IJN92_10295 [Lachnospiraceae bacterium]|nr:hypothetical protein [Lachnospiraceae bacterium]
MEEQKKSENKNFLIYTAIIFFSTFVTFLGCYLLKKPVDEIIRNMIVTIVLSLIVVLSLAVSGQKKSLFFNNFEHLGRFFTCYILGLLFSVSAIFLPLKVLPILLPAIFLSLTSNTIAGSIAYVNLVFMMLFFSDMSSYGFFMCIFVGLAGMALFQNIDEEYLVNGAMFASLILLFIGETAFLILFDKQKISLDAFVLPMMNVCISLVALIVFLRIYSSKIVHKYRDRYQEINDPDFILLAKLKDESPKEYYHAVHTAYFCDKIARKIGANFYLAKAGGYYHKIGKGLNKTLEIAEEYKFPPELIELLTEYGDKDKKITKKETALVLFADGVVSSITYLLEKDKKATLDYKQVVDIVFEKKLESEILNQCNITMNELTIMRNLFVEEKLYYDFLR